MIMGTAAALVPLPHSRNKHGHGNPKKGSVINWRLFLPTRLFSNKNIFIYAMRARRKKRAGPAEERLVVQFARIIDDGP